MFASGIRLKGLELFAKLRIAEGIPLCMKIIKLETWGKARRTPVCLKILAKYGGAARGSIGELKAVKQRFSSDRRMAKLMSASIAEIDRTIAKIEADKNPPKLRSLNLR